jgi:hypothetical protein
VRGIEKEMEPMTCDEIEVSVELKNLEGLK